MSRRFEELDSLRGLAAISVLFSHFLLVFPVVEKDTYRLGFQFIPNIFKYSPLHIVFAGHQAVIFFFMLSGFVLYLMVDRSTKFEYVPYLVKRTLRIYPPYIIAVIIAVVAKTFFNTGNLNGLSLWIQNLWESKTTVLLFLQHVVFLGEFNSNDFDPVLWSLVHEMRISIFFPILVVMVRKTKWIYPVLISVFLSAISLILIKVFIVEYNTTNYFVTLHYSSIFILGAVLAKYREKLIDICGTMSLVKRYGLLIFGVISYTFAFLFFDIKLIHNTFTNDLAAAMGTGIFMIFALSSSKASKIMLVKPIVFLGKISYSLYLYHAIVLAVMINVFYDKINLAIILGLSLILSILVSWIAFETVEKWAIDKGRRYSKLHKAKLFREESKVQ